jgi:hypothetical protein
MAVRLTLRRAIGLSLLIAWLPLATNLWPLPGRSEAASFSQWMVTIAEKQGEKETVAFWSDVEGVQAFFLRRWVITLVSLGAGIIASAMALRRTRGWPLALLGASIFYLVLVMPPSKTLLPTEFNLHLWLGFAIRGTRGILIVLKELLLPLAQIAVLVWMIAYLVVGTLRRRTHEI